MKEGEYLNVRQRMPAGILNIRQLSKPINGCDGFSLFEFRISCDDCSRKFLRRCHDEGIHVGDRMERLHMGSGKDPFCRDINQIDRQTGNIFCNFFSFLFPSLAGDNVINFAETDYRQGGRNMTA